MISFEKFARDYVVSTLATTIRDNSISREPAGFPAPDTKGPLAPVFYGGRWHIIDVMTARMDPPGLFMIPIGKDGSNVVVDMREMWP